MFFVLLAIASVPFLVTAITFIVLDHYAGEAQ
jgi:hypothetical protein